MRGAIQVVLIGMVAVAAWSDFKSRHIPNWIPVSGVLLGFMFHTYYGGASEAFTSLAGAGLGLAIFLPLYMLGGMGAGDVKLFSAVGALAGPQPLILVFVLTGLLGGIAAAGLAASRGRLRETLHQTGELMLNLGRLHWQEARGAAAAAGTGALRLPYGVVIAGGTLLSLILQRL